MSVLSDLFLIVSYQRRFSSIFKYLSANAYGIFIDLKLQARGN